MTNLRERRAQRGREGSRRQRDVKAVAEDRLQASRERRQILVQESKKTPASEQAWKKTLDHLRRSVPGPTFEVWFSSLRLVGEVRGSLHVESQEAQAVWTERKYGPLMGECVRAASDFQGVYVSPFEEVDF